MVPQLEKVVINKRGHDPVNMKHVKIALVSVRAIFACSTLVEINIARVLNLR